jgi:hypothetical protein
MHFWNEWKKLKSMKHIAWIACNENAKAILKTSGAKDRSVLGFEFGASSMKRVVSLKPMWQGLCAQNQSFCHANHTWTTTCRLTPKSHANQRHEDQITLWKRNPRCSYVFITDSYAQEQLYQKSKMNTPLASSFNTQHGSRLGLC